MRHATLESAQAHVDRMVARGAKRSMLFVYPTPPATCKWCKGYHVGHKNVRAR